jgi:hypothetical protein
MNRLSRWNCPTFSTNTNGDPGMEDAASPTASLAVATIEVTTTNHSPISRERLSNRKTVDALFFESIVLELTF